jgi:hypothetical protein
MKTLISVDVGERQKENWCRTKSMEHYYKGICTDDEYGQNNDYEDFKEPEHKH